MFRNTFENARLKKSAKIVFLLLIGLFLSGCGVKNKLENKVKEKINEEFTGNLQQAMKLGVPMKCEWRQNENKGTSYVKGKNLYAEMTTNGKTAYFIQKDGCMWVWDQEQPQGTKICSDKNEVEEPVLPETNSDFKAKGVNLDVEYKCNPALIGDEKFNPPADKNFIDLQQMMQGLTVPSMQTEE